METVNSLRLINSLGSWCPRSQLGSAAPPEEKLVRRKESFHLSEKKGFSGKRNPSGGRDFLRGRSPLVLRGPLVKGVPRSEASNGLKKFVGSKASLGSEERPLGPGLGAPCVRGFPLVQKVP